MENPQPRRDGHCWPTAITWTEMGRTIALLRASRGVSREDLARALGIPPSGLACYESGEAVPDLPAASRLFAMLHCTADEVETVLVVLRVARCQASTDEAFDRDVERLSAPLPRAVAAA